jgi:hypothetical protein
VNEGREKRFGQKLERMEDNSRWWRKEGGMRFVGAQGKVRWQCKRGSFFFSEWRFWATENHAVRLR